jgi:hypothetical protein
VRRFGQFVLLTNRSFHRWHKVHLGLGLAVLIAGVLFEFLGWHGKGTSEEVEHLIGKSSIGLFALYLCVWIIAAVLARLWPPPVLPILKRLPEPLEMPNDGRHWKFGTLFGAKFRYRFASLDDLSYFVAFSMAHPSVLIANPDLDEKERLELYERWYSSTPTSFMVLETEPANQSSWSPIAVSIVLPLSEAGAHELWTGNTRTIEFEERHLAKPNARPTVLLVDTLAAGSTYKARKACFADLVLALPQVHAAQFWKPEGRKKMEYWIEPDHRALPRSLQRLGFEGPHEIARGHKLFRLSVPPLKRNLSERQSETLARLIENLKKCGGWQIQ